MTAKTIILTTNGLSLLQIDGQTYNAYAWAGRIHWFGQKHAVKVLASGTSLEHKAVGSFSQWIKAIGRLLVGNPYLIVALVHCLATAIRRRFGVPHLNLGFVGPSSSGKTTTQVVAYSPIGPPKGVIPMSGTVNGLLDHLLDRPDQPVFFQDTRQVDKLDDYLNLIFMTADGGGRRRSGETPKMLPRG